MTDPSPEQLFADYGPDREAPNPPDAAAPAVVGYVRVALERSIDLADGGLTYALPESLSATGVGDRVEVPLGRGNRPAQGIVVHRYPADTELTELGLAEDTTVKRVLRRLGTDLADADAGRPSTAAQASKNRGPNANENRSGPSGEAGGDRGRRGGGGGLPADLVELARWIAGYYCCPLGMVLASMTPAAVKQGTGTRQRLEVRCPPPAASDSASNGSTEIKKLSKLQREVLDAAAAPGQVGRWVEADALAQRAGAKSRASIKALIDRGLLESRRRAVVVSDLDLRAQRVSAQPPPDLTAAQAQAVATLTAALGAGFGVHLLHGVTGSGKTEVYLRTIRALLAADPTPTRPATEPQTQNPAQIGDNDKGGDGGGGGDGGEGGGDEGGGGGVIVLVPEIALTPQTVGRFLNRFGHEGAADSSAGVAVLHSGLTAAQRHAQWQRIRRGKARIVIGARSAVFAPLPRVGLIIVDEEHESSYKQDQLPRYHARDVAVKRGQMAGCPVVLGSATPSLESYHNAVTPVATTAAGDPPAGGSTPPRPDDSPADADDEPDADIVIDAGVATDTQPAAGSPARRSTRYGLIALPDRVPGAQLPDVEIVDLARERRERRGVHLLSARLESALRANLEAGGQAMLLLNRRGYANYLACPDHRCGWMMRCEHCDVTMIYHRGAGGGGGGG